MNLGKFETRMSENLELARRYGQTVYAMTGDGLIQVGTTAPPVPVNVLDLSTSELNVWSSLINEQLLENGIKPEKAVILAAGRNHRCFLPLGTTITQDIRLGA